MSDRESFEKWFDSPTETKCWNGEIYDSQYVQMHWEAYQAGRASMRDECVEVLDSKCLGYQKDGTYWYDGDMIEAIKELP